jgi:hypothetical protein
VGNKGKGVAPLRKRHFKAQRSDPLKGIGFVKKPKRGGMLLRWHMCLYLLVLLHRCLGGGSIKLLSSPKRGSHGPPGWCVLVTAPVALVAPRCDAGWAALCAMAPGACWCSGAGQQFSGQPALALMLALPMLTLPLLLLPPLLLQAPTPS